MCHVSCNISFQSSGIRSFSYLKCMGLFFSFEKKNHSCAPSRGLERWNTFPVEHQIQYLPPISKAEVRGQRQFSGLEKADDWCVRGDLCLHSDQTPIPFLSLPSSWLTIPLCKSEKPRDWGSLLQSPHMRTWLTFLAGARLQEHLYFQSMEKIKVKIVFCRKLSGSIGKYRNVSCCWGGQGSGRGENWTLTDWELNEIIFLKQPWKLHQIKYCKTGLCFKLWLLRKKALEKQECESLPTPVSNHVTNISFLSYKSKRSLAQHYKGRLKACADLASSCVIQILSHNNANTRKKWILLSNNREYCQINYCPTNN